MTADSSLKISLEPVELDYVLLDEAMGEGTVTIKEKGDGTVPELVAINVSDSEILVLDGDCLLGAKQDRMVNRSLILPGKSETSIPVSCVERGRWRTRSDKFSFAAKRAPQKTRKPARDVEAGAVSEGEAAAAARLSMAQGKVWDEVRLYSDAAGVHAPTEALHDVHEGREGADDGVERFLGQVTALEDQVGMMIFHGSTVLGMDVVGGRSLYTKLHERLLGGYALDVLRVRTELDGAVPDEADGLRFLDGAARATRTLAPTPGLGEYAVLTGEVVGAELTSQGRLVHRNAFP